MHDVDDAVQPRHVIRREPSRETQLGVALTAPGGSPITERASKARSSPRRFLVCAAVGGYADAAYTSRARHWAGGAGGTAAVHAAVVEAGRCRGRTAEVITGRLALDPAGQGISVACRNAVGRRRRARITGCAAAAGRKHRHARAGRCVGTTMVVRVAIDPAHVTRADRLGMGVRRGGACLARSCSPALGSAVVGEAAADGRAGVCAGAADRAANGLRRAGRARRTGRAVDAIHGSAGGGGRVGDAKSIAHVAASVAGGHTLAARVACNAAVRGRGTHRAGVSA